MNVKNANAFREKVDIFFQNFNRDIIILNRFLFDEVFDSLITSTFPIVLKEKELPLYCILYCCNAGCLLYFIIDFNLGQDILSNCRSKLFDSGIWSEDTIFEKESLKMLATSF